MSAGQALRPPEDEVAKIPKLLDFKHTRTRLRVFTHRSYYARPNAVFEDPPGDIAPDNETLEFVGDSVLNLAVATLITGTYPGLRVGPLAKVRSLVVQNATIAQISEHYQLAQQLRANTSQLYNLRFSPGVQADLFEAYLGGLYADWGYEHIKPWLVRVLKPYVDEAYRQVQSEYIDPSVGPSKPPTSGASPVKKPSDAGSPQWQSPSKIDSSPLSAEAVKRSAILKSMGVGPQVIQVSAMQYTANHPIGVFEKKGMGSLSSGSPILPGYSPAVQSDAPPKQFMQSAVAEGHLPLLNQVLQHAKRWVDWEYKEDPKAPSTTPIWESVGKMSDVEICRGRGNTKKLAKNDAARCLVTELQNRAGKPCTTSDLAKELVNWYTEQRSMAGPDKVEHDTILVNDMSELNVGKKRQPNLHYSESTRQMS